MLLVAIWIDLIEDHVKHRELVLVLLLCTSSVIRLEPLRVSCCIVFFLDRIKVFVGHFNVAIFLGCDLLKVSFDNILQVQISVLQLLLVLSVHSFNVALQLLLLAQECNAMLL